jgi:hypothetical protein
MINISYKFLIIYLRKTKKSNLLQTENKVALSNVNIKNKNEQKHRF